VNEDGVKYVNGQTSILYCDQDKWSYFEVLSILLINIETKTTLTTTTQTIPIDRFTRFSYNLLLFSKL